MKINKRIKLEKELERITSALDYWTQRSRACPITRFQFLLYRKMEIINILYNDFIHNSRSR